MYSTQRRLAWPLHKEDARKSRGMNNHIVLLLFLLVLVVVVVIGMNDIILPDQAYVGGSAYCATKHAVNASVSVSSSIRN